MDEDLRISHSKRSTMRRQKAKAIWTIIIAHSWVLVTERKTLGAVHPVDAEDIMEYYQPTMNNLIATARDFTRKHPS